MNGKSLTRRLFARSAAVAPLAADAVLQQRAATTYSTGSLTGGCGPVSSGTSDKQWSLARTLLRPARKLLESRQNRNAVMGGLDPDILALRSISPSYKARMLAERRQAMDEEDASLWQWAKRKVGLPEDA